MTQDPSRRLGLGSPTLVRLLAGLTDAQACAPAQPLAEQLVQWLGWSDAIALSGALNGAPPATPAGAAEEGAGQGEYALLRASLKDAIEAANAPPAKRRNPWGGGVQGKVRATPTDYPTYRQRYVSLQQKMETRIAELRARLRGMLSSRTPEMARLALVDAAMEQALAPHEQTLLLKTPALLEQHFNRLRREAEAAALAQAAPQAGAPGLDTSAQAAPQSAAPEHDTPRQAAPPAPARQAPALASVSPAWLDVFRKDMQSLLLVELDLRLQPIEGLLAALRASEPETL